MKKSKITYALPGLTFKDLDGKRHRIGKCCKEDNGHWVCLTCKKQFDCNGVLDIHVMMPGEHKLAWRCDEHDRFESVKKSA